LVALIHEKTRAPRYGYLLAEKISPNFLLQASSLNLLFLELPLRKRYVFDEKSTRCQQDEVFLSIYVFSGISNVRTSRFDE